MESLALLVGAMYLGLIALSLVTFGFALTYRLKQKLRKTAIVATVLLSFLAIWASSLNLAFGAVPVAGTVISALLIFWPRRTSSK